MMPDASTAGGIDFQAQGSSLIKPNIKDVELEKMAPGAEAAIAGMGALVLCFKWSMAQPSPLTIMETCPLFGAECSPPAMSTAIFFTAAVVIFSAAAARSSFSWLEVLHVPLQMAFVSLAAIFACQLFWLPYHAGLFSIAMWSWSKAVAAKKSSTFLHSVVVRLQRHLGLAPPPTLEPPLFVNAVLALLSFLGAVVWMELALKLVGVHDLLSADAVPDPRNISATSNPSSCARCSRCSKPCPLLMNDDDINNKVQINENSAPPASSNSRTLGSVLKGMLWISSKNLAASVRRILGTFSDAHFVIAFKAGYADSGSVTFIPE